MNNQQRITQGLFWKLLERFGVQGTQFIVQLVLARLLDPDHYGMLSLMVIFTSLANVFIQRGFNTALIQNEHVTEEDYSSVFWITMGVAALLYGVLYFTAPLISLLYGMPEFVTPFRVMCLVLLPGAVNSIQLAKISREMDFRQVFRSNVASIIVSGLAGILLALLGAGIWALVVQNMLNITVACVVMWFSVKWRPRAVCNIQRIKHLFSYGWKLLVSSLLDTLYNDVYSLVIGKKYDAGTLGYYNRGKQFPQFIINAINTTVQTVMLPAMSAEQSNKGKVRDMMRNSITISSFLIFPMMAGLAGVATPLVRLLLTEKWLPSVPYMQICCFSLAFLPVHSCNLQAINAMGRSDIFLKLEIIKKIMGLSMVAVAVVCFDTPMAIAGIGIVSTVINCFVNSYPNKKLVGYSYFEQIRDIFPALIISLIMFGCVSLIGMLNLPDLVLIVVQIFVGVIVYVGISAAAGVKTFKVLLDMLKKLLKKDKNDEVI